MSSAYNDDFFDFYSKYVNDPSKQVNLGWTVVSFAWIAAIFIGLSLMTMTFVIVMLNQNLSNGLTSKRGIMALAYIGFALVLVGIWCTINSFYKVAARIDANVKRNPACSLFVNESATTATELLIDSAWLPDNVQNLLNVAQPEKIKLKDTSGVDPRAGSNSLFSLLPQNRKAAIVGKEAADAIKAAESAKIVAEEAAAVAQSAAEPTLYNRALSAVGYRTAESANEQARRAAETASRLETEAKRASRAAEAASAQAKKDYAAQADAELADAHGLEGRDVRDFLDALGNEGPIVSP